MSKSFAVACFALSIGTCARCESQELRLIWGGNSSDAAKYVAAYLDSAMSHIRMLEYAPVRDELDVTDEQMDELQEARAKGKQNWDAELNSIGQQFQKQSPEGHYRQLYEAERTEKELLESESRERFEKASTDRVSEILMPHQLRQLRGMILWVVTNNLNRFDLVFSATHVREAAGLTEKDVTDLESKRQELQVEFQAELDKLRLKYRNNLIDSLEPKKRKRFHELYGEPSLIGSPPLKF